jgi:hypothetical protein
MNRRTRYLLALTLVATTLCAGRLFASDRTDRADTKPATEKLVARLTRCFSHTVSRTPIIVHRQWAAPITTLAVMTPQPCTHSTTLSPLQSNLPPPAI